MIGILDGNKSTKSKSIFSRENFFHTLLYKTSSLWTPYTSYLRLRISLPSALRPSSSLLYTGITTGYHHDHLVEGHPIRFAHIRYQYKSSRAVSLGNWWFCSSRVIGQYNGVATCFEINEILWHHPTVLV
jgi:hypothetical protein